MTTPADHWEPYGNTLLDFIADVPRGAVSWVRGWLIDHTYSPERDIVESAPADQAADIRLLVVLVVVALLIALLALVIALIALVIGQRNRPQPAPTAQWLADEVQMLPSRGPVVEIGYRSNYPTYPEPQPIPPTR